MEDLQEEFKFLKRESLSEPSKLRFVEFAFSLLTEVALCYYTTCAHKKKYVDTAKSNVLHQVSAIFYEAKVHSSKRLFALHSWP